EEPPDHVKFLLATTDPQKLPVTVLSRCLQFNLRRLEQSQIAGQMSRILQAENIDFDPPALSLLARAADGSLRDGLSLLDQAIAYTAGKLEESGVNAMLGTVERAQVGALLQALRAGDGGKLIAEVDEMAQYSPDFGHVLEDLAIELHRIQLHQLVPGFESEDSRIDAPALAAALTPELVQLWYQMAVQGRRDLGIAPSARAGFEMALLRMLAFRPADVALPTEVVKPPGRVSAADKPPSASAAATRVAVGDAAVAKQPADNVAVAKAPASYVSASKVPAGDVEVAKVSLAPVPVADSLAPDAAHPMRIAEPSTVRAARPMQLHNGEDWLALVAGAGLKGPALQLGAHSVFCAYEDGQLRLFLPAEDAHLRADSLVKQLTSAISAVLGSAVQIRFEDKTAAPGETLHLRNERQRSERQLAAEASFLADPVVGQLLGQGGSIVPDSIRPLSEN
ncbi:MAG: DNA polymerase III subunit gamma/tau, partial [Arenimonas sp.]